MSAKRPLPPDEAWEALQKMALDDELERVAALSDRELDRELIAESAPPPAPAPPLPRPPDTK